jgi:hypothetical protein
MPRVRVNELRLSANDLSRSAYAIGDARTLIANLRPSSPVWRGQQGRTRTPLAPGGAVEVRRPASPVIPETEEVQVPDPSCAEGRTYLHITFSAVGTLAAP